VRERLKATTQPTERPDNRAFLRLSWSRAVAQVSGAAYCPERPLPKAKSVPGAASLGAPPIRIALHQEMVEECPLPPPVPPKAPSCPATPPKGELQERGEGAERLRRARPSGSRWRGVPAISAPSWGGERTAEGPSSGARAGARRRSFGRRPRRCGAPSARTSGPTAGPPAAWRTRRGRRRAA